MATASHAQKLYYITVLVPIWRGLLDTQAEAMRTYRLHLLAAECLRVAKGPGADPLKLSEFCKKWTIPLTVPVIGPVALLRRAGKAVAGWPSAAAVFDPTGAINMGVKVLARMGPLIGQIQMRNAILVALDDDVLEKRDRAAVGSILEKAGTPARLMASLKSSKSELEASWKVTQDYAQKMAAAQKQHGLPDTG